MILLVCGGRNFANEEHFNWAMERLPQPPSIIVNGGCSGADKMGIDWAIKNGINYATVPAIWERGGGKEGPKRNAAMLLLRPNWCLAMPGGRGTEDMVKLCIKNDVPVWRPFDKMGG